MPGTRRKRRIYLAAAFKHQLKMRSLREALAELGYEVLGSWLDEDPWLDGKLTRGSANQLVDKCVYEILKASIFLCYIDSTDSGRGGHQTEFGYAWAKGKILISVGSAERNIFHEMWKVKQYLTVEDFLEHANSWKNFLPQAL